MEITRNGNITIVTQDTLDDIKINAFINDYKVVMLHIKDGFDYISLEIDLMHIFSDENLNKIYTIKNHILNYIRQDFNRVEEYHIIKGFFTDFLKSVENGDTYFFGRSLIEDYKAKTYTEKF